ncbi:MAG: HEAT repeat domain-containing protein [Chloroflexi bacterium]|nr:HEAT repeat domain-containing protein [Chloroflexota bacterium]GIW10745.1 MAG: PBS lyase [Dehalococcoidia bacterium]
MSIARLFAEILAQPRPSVLTRLQALSDLSAEQQAEFAQVWPTLPTERRRQIVSWLGELAEDNIQLNFEAVFAALLDDPDPEVRRGAIDGLWESNDWSLVPRFVRLLQEDRDATVRAAAATALGKYALAVELGARSSRYGPEVDEALLAAFNDPAEAPIVRRRALEAISPRSLSAVTEAIIEARASDLPDLRLAAIYAMGRTCDERWLDDLLEALTQSDPAMRYEALGALGELEAAAAVPEILPLLEDEDSEVRLAAISALGKIGGEEAKAALRRLAGRPSPVQEAALDALAEAEFNDFPLG